MKKAAGELPAALIQRRVTRSLPAALLLAAPLGRCGLLLARLVAGLAGGRLLLGGCLASRRLLLLGGRAAARGAGASLLLSLLTADGALGPRDVAVTIHEVNVVGI